MPVDLAAVLVGVVFSGFRGVMCRMNPVPVSDMRVVRGFPVIPGFVMLGSLAMMIRCVFVVFCRLLVMLCAFVGCHDVSFLGAT